MPESATTGQIISSTGFIVDLFFAARRRSLVVVRAIEEIFFFTILATRGA